tara:strand:- start:7857 stop:8378 length:522 start_codon:yes stop_codon:yes gene_type:complete
LIKVVDDYFPEWLVKNVSSDLELMPVTYTNSSHKDFKNARFFGNTLMKDDNFTGQYWWFIEYFNKCIYNDVCKEFNINHCARVLLNGQLPNMNGWDHVDSDNEDHLSVIYMGHGTSGDTVIGDERVTFKEGRMVVFNSHLVHRGEAPAEGYRVSLGAVYPLFDPFKLSNLIGE